MGQREYGTQYSTPKSTFTFLRVVYSTGVQIQSTCTRSTRVLRISNLPPAGSGFWDVIDDIMLT